MDYNKRVKDALKGLTLLRDIAMIACVIVDIDVNEKSFEIVRDQLRVAVNAWRKKK